MHPLVFAYEHETLYPTLTNYVRWCVEAVSAPSEDMAEYWLDRAELLEQDMTREHIDFGRLIAELVLDHNRRRGAA